MSARLTRIEFRNAKGERVELSPQMSPVEVLRLGGSVVCREWARTTHHGRVPLDGGPSGMAKEWEGRSGYSYHASSSTVGSNPRCNDVVQLVVTSANAEENRDEVDDAMREWRKLLPMWQTIEGLRAAAGKRRDFAWRRVCHADVYAQTERDPTVAESLRAEARRWRATMAQAEAAREVVSALRKAYLGGGLPGKL